MTSNSPDTVWERSDRLLSGGLIAVRAIVVPQDDVPHGAVALTVQIAPGQSHVSDSGAVTGTVLVGPGEALGISAWLRQAAQAADKAGPPLYDWAPDEASQDPSVEPGPAAQDGPGHSTSSA